MTTVINFDPLPSVLCWLAEKYSHGKVHPLAKIQKWYQGVFEEASTKDKYFSTDNHQGHQNKRIHF
jgi:hypothetical protein